MADRRYDEPTFGNPGRLAYEPAGARQAEDWGWLTARNLDGDRVPKFSQVGSHHEWLAATHDPSPTFASGSWQESQKQRRWLLKNHPEAALGNDGLGELLAVETAQPRRPQASSWGLEQFAVGQMADTSSDVNKSVAVPLLAMAAGSAGDVLRLVRPTASRWQVEKSGTTGHVAELQVLDSVRHQETLWTKDVGTIRRIRAVVSTRRFDPVRWLIVQRDSSTAVFRPEYQKVPVASESFSGTGPQDPSHIAPNLLFSLSTKQTGLNSHSDAAFNPGVKSKPPQLAIIDDGGNWSIWDVAGTRNRSYKRPQVRLSRCGNIREGVRERLSRRLATDPQWHRILWVGHADPEDDVDDSDQDDSAHFESTFSPLERSSTLLLCNQRLLKLFDLETNNFLPDLRLIAEGSKDIILDVQVDPRDARYVYILTAKRIVVATTYATESSAHYQVEKKVSVIRSFPHLRSRFDRHLHITVAPGSSTPAGRTSVLLLYSRDSGWHDVFCLGFSKQWPDRVSCYHDKIVSQNPLASDGVRGLQKLYLAPVPVATFVASGNASRRNDINFYQLFTFGTDLSLSYCLSMRTNLQWHPDSLSLRSASISERPVEEGSRRLRSKSDKYSSQELERQRAVRYLSSRFVVADSIVEFHKKVDKPAVKAAKSTSRTLKQQRMIRPVHELFQTILLRLQAEDGDASTGMDIYGVAPFDPVFVSLQEAMETRSLPLKPIFDMVQNFRTPRDMNETSQDWHSEIEQLRHVDPALTIVSLSTVSSTLDTANYIEDLYTSLSGSMLGTSHAETDYTGMSRYTGLGMRQIACELYLSRIGIAYIPLELYETPGADSLDIRSSPTIMPEDMLQASQESNRSSALSPNVYVDSQASSRASTPASTVPSVAAKSEPENDSEDKSIALLRALTGSGKSIARLNLPSKWNVGEDISRHAWSIDQNTEITPGMQRRAKQEARQARKRKRAETLLRLQQEHSLAPSTQPVSDTRFYTQTSQPMNDFSSQTRIMSSAPPVTMSQPVPGIFSSRPNLERPKKKPKRKGGF
ncbi:uncharacterized protein JN550_005969 [Neoarthrinium moseri]|uniref:uncharacterized protein n=1 Tax=Neoarthrinium moseri TaxID=1658444 RepID=UPI001FDD7FFE|nr:uncharacterized protein JN550_005969 [Neoarthrinium moseri]KAI1869339.1 hypothetical protein JN550_005969 [Neoarthrinium moseri]